jgi:hypothetical protein
MAHRYFPGSERPQAFGRVQAVFFSILYIIEYIHDGSEDRKNHKTQCGDGERSAIKKAKAEKERNKYEEIFDVMVEAQESGVIFEGTHCAPPLRRR